MNYYEHHIRDYDADTSHLSWLEDMAYTRLIRLYYRKEKPVPPDVQEVCRLIRAASKEQKEAVECVLREFFVLCDDGWRHDYCDRAIAAYQAAEPEREARRVNEETRVKRHRTERAELFQALNAAGKHAPWNIGIKELRAMVEGNENSDLEKPVTPPVTEPVTPVTPPVTPLETAPVTPATATQTPIPNTQYPDTKVNPSSPDTSSPSAQAQSAPSQKGRKHSFSDADIECAKWLYAELLTIRKELKQPNIEAWANDVRLMVEQDGRTHREICALMRWACNDSFWRGNIMSPDKLRKQYDQIAIKAKSAASPGKSKDAGLHERNMAFAREMASKPPPSCFGVFGSGAMPADANVIDGQAKEVNP